MKTRISTQATALSVDEARAALITSAVRCLTVGSCSADGIAAILWGLPGGAGWTPVEEVLAVEHRRVLEMIADAGHGWIITEEIEGIVAATELAAGHVVNVDVVRAQVGGDSC